MGCVFIISHAFHPNPTHNIDIVDSDISIMALYSYQVSKLCLNSYSIIRINAQRWKHILTNLLEIDNVSKVAVIFWFYYFQCGKSLNFIIYGVVYCMEYLTKNVHKLKIIIEIFMIEINRGRK